MSYQGVSNVDTTLQCVDTYGNPVFFGFVGDRRVFYWIGDNHRSGLPWRLWWGP